MEHGTDLFYDHASIDYPIIDADAHVNEPPDTWAGARAAKFKRARAQGDPHATRATSGRFDDGERVRPVGSHRHRRPLVPRLLADRA